MSNKPPGIIRYWQSLLLAIVPGLCVMAVYFMVCIPLANKQVAKVHAGGVASARAAAIDSSIAMVSSQLEGLARQSEIRAALNATDWQQIGQIEDNWAALFPDMERLSLIPIGRLGIAGLGENKLRLRNNIEKDLVAKAMGSDAVIVDAYQLKGDYVLSYAKSVSLGGREVGVVLLSLRSAWIDHQLERFSTMAGAQTIGVSTLTYSLAGAKPVVIATDTGSVSHADIVTRQTASLNVNPNIAVVFALQELPAVLFAVTPILMLAILAAIVFSVFALLLLLQAAYKRADDDALTLKGFIGQMFQGQVERPSFTHPAFNLVIDVFLKGLKHTRENENSREAIKAQPIGVTEIDAQSWDNPGISKMAVDADPAEALVSTSAAAPEHIFRAYDIRGLADQELGDEVVHVIGQAIGATAIDQNCASFVVGRDGRLSSERIARALIAGLTASGCDVVDIGLVATPVLYFAVETLDAQSGVMITGSHNAPEYNGMKIVLNGQALADESIAALYRRIEQVDFHEGQGQHSERDMIDAYMDRITSDVVFAAPLKVVLDCGNGASSEIAPALYAALGCEVIPLFAEVDGNFPNHLPDPGEADNLAALIAEVTAQGADLGLAFDGDADRVVAVSADGSIIYADQLMMLFAKDVLNRNPGSDVVFDIKCSRNLTKAIAEAGGRPVMWKSGHSRIKRKMRETSAMLGGEFSGHFFFAERWFGFDDGMYSGARLIEYLTLEGQGLAEAVAQLPKTVGSPEIYLPVDEASKFDIIEQIRAADFTDGEKSELDGLRVDYPWGWGLIRASNTSAKLTARFEADSAENLQRTRDIFAAALANIDASLILP